MCGVEFSSCPVLIVGTCNLLRRAFVSQGKITITRAELYEKIWTTPVRKLSKEFGLSDVGLAKLCRRHNIPLPGRGYWARIQFGQKPTRLPLPTVTDARLETIEV